MVTPGGESRGPGPSLKGLKVNSDSGVRGINKAVWWAIGGGLSAGKQPVARRVTRGAFCGKKLVPRRNRMELK